MPVIHPSKTEIDDFDRMPLEEMFRRFLEHILDNDLLTDGCFDDADPDGPDDNLELPQKTKYSMASELMGCPQPSLQFPGQSVQGVP